MYAVIMAGGSGTRLWPLSRQDKPKQFHAFTGEQPMLVESVERLLPLIPKEQLFIGTTKPLLAQCKSLLPQTLSENFFVEPYSRNTGPAVGLAAAILAKRDKNAVVAALWSDHHIGRPEEFRQVLAAAEKAVIKHPDAIVAIGINPTEPSTALGYIRMNSGSEEIDGHRIFKVKEFIEKPDLATAKRYVSSWQYLWNAGYFVFNASHMLDLFAKHAPAIHQGLMKTQKAIGTKNEDKVLDTEFKKFPIAPIDTLIIEKVKKMYVLPADLDWSDIGSWSTLHDLLANKHGQLLITKGNHIGIGDENLLVYAKEKLIATVGLKNVIIVDTPDALLILNKDKSQDIKQLLEKLKSEGKHLYL